MKDPSSFCNNCYLEEGGRTIIVKNNKVTLRIRQCYVPPTFVFLTSLFFLSTLVLPMGDIPMDGISVADIGPAVASLFESPQAFLGKPVGLTAQRLTIKQYAEILSKHTGKKVLESKITPDMYEKLGFPGAKELADMFRYKWMKPYRDIELTRQLNPNVRSFDQFLSENKEALKDL